MPHNDSNPVEPCPHCGTPWRDNAFRPGDYVGSWDCGSCPEPRQPTRAYRSRECVLIAALRAELAKMQRWIDKHGPALDEVAALRAERDEALADRDYGRANEDRMADEVAALRAERDALKDALAGAPPASDAARYWHGMYEASIAERDALRAVVEAVMEPTALAHGDAGNRARAAVDAYRATRGGDDAAR